MKKNHITISLILLFNLLAILVYFNSNYSKKEVIIEKEKIVSNINLIDLEKLKNKNYGINTGDSNFKISNDMLVTSFKLSENQMYDTEYYKNIFGNKEEISNNPRENKTLRSDDYYTKTRSNKYLNEVGLEKFLEEYGKEIFLVIPRFTTTKKPGYFGIMQDGWLQKDDLRKYFTDKININGDNNEREYNINMTIYSQKEGDGIIEYIPFDDSKLNGYYDTKEPFKKIIIDNISFPDIKSIKINGKDAEIKVISEHDKTFNEDGKEYTVKFYNKTYKIKGNFKKGFNNININMFQHKRSSIGYY